MKQLSFNHDKEWLQIYVNCRLLGALKCLIEREFGVYSENKGDHLIIQRTPLFDENTFKEIMEYVKNFIDQQQKQKEV